MKRSKTSSKGRFKRLKQLTELNKTDKIKKSQSIASKPEFSLFPDVGTILDYIENEHYPTISSISRAFKMHRITASEIITKLKKHGLVLVEPVGSAKIIKIAKE